MDMCEYMRLSMTLPDNSQSLSTEAEDLGSLSPVKFQWPGMFRLGDFAFISPISPSVSETKRFQGSEESDQGAFDERAQRESPSVYKLPHSS
jgi:hypothetical protein